MPPLACDTQVTKRSKTISFARSNGLGLLLSLFLCTTPNLTHANPQGGVVTGGKATITTPAPNTMQINQTSGKSVINWQSYNIGANERVHYQQPNSSSISLNRINSANGASKIYGTLTSNGQVWLTNGAGIWFGPSAHVDVSGLIATTASISNRDFFAGRYRFTETPDSNGAIINEGEIILRNAGLAALVGNGVVNNGMIQAELGSVILASGKAFTVSMDGNALIGFTVNKSTSKLAHDQNGNPLTDAIKNTGVIRANGGKVLISAHTASQVLDHAINLKGIVEVSSVSVKNGEIFLDAGSGGTINVTGKIYAKGNNPGETGGTVNITGKKVILADNADIDVSGYAGGGTILVGGNAHGAGPLLNADNTFIGSDVHLTADALTIGNGGTVVVWSNLGTYFYGNIHARGGATGGNGGFIETSGKDYLIAIGDVNASAPLGQSGEWLLDPRNVTIQNVSSSGGTFNGLSPNVFTPTSDNAIADRNTIQTSLNGGTSVTINTGASGSQNGDITVSDTISKTAGGAATLLLTAANTGTITINQTISSTTGALNVTLNGAATININANITTLGGAFSSTSLGATTLGAALSTGAGTVTINTNTGGSGANNFTISGGSITTTNATANAVAINVNAAGGGTGGIALGGSITAGSAAASRITLATNTGGNTSGGSITQSAGSLTNGTGGITLSVPTASSSGIGTSGTPIATASTGTFTLTTGTGGTYISNTGNMTLAAPTLNANSPFSIVSSGTLTLPGASLSTGTGDLTLQSNGGTLATIATRTLTTTSGHLTLVGATGLTLNSAALTTGSGNINLSTTTSGSITQNSGGTISSTSGNLNMTTLNAVSLADAINMGSGTVTIAANTDGAGANAFTMNAGSSITTTNSSSSAVAINVNAAGGGNGTAGLRGISIGSGGTITVTTNTGGNTTGGNITFAGTSALDAGTGTISLTTSQTAGRAIGTLVSNILITANTLNATTGTGSIFITNNGTGTLTLGTVNTTGSLTLISTSSASIVDSGTQTISGTATYDAGATHDITLDTAANNFGTVAITSGNHVTLVDTNAIILGTSTISGTLNLTAGGTISESGTLTIIGTPTFTLNTATTDILLSTQANDFATTPVITDNGNIRDLLLRNVSSSAVAPSIPSGLRDLTLTFNNASSLALPAITLSRTLSVTTNGPITQTGALIIPTTATFAAGNSHDITLSNTANNFGTVAITSGNNVTLIDTNALNLGTSTVSGTLTITAGGALTDSGVLTITGLTTLDTGTNSITLNTAGDNFSSVKIINAQNVTLVDTDTLIMDTSTIGGTLNLTTGGALTQSGALTVLGATTLNAGASNNITLDNTSNDFSTVTTTAGNNVILKDTNAIALGASTISGTLDVTAGGNISQTGALTITGTPTFTVTAATSNITLGSANTFNTTPVFATSGSGSIQDITLRNIAATAVVPTLPSGLRNLSLTFNNAAMVLPSLTLTGTLAATTGGAITQSGALNITGTSTFSAGSGNNITLDTFANNFSTVITTTGNNVAYRDSNAIIMGASIISGTLSITAGGSITQAGTTTVTGTPTFTVTAANSNITLGNGNTFNTTPIFTTSGAGTIQNITFRNIAATAATPIMPTSFQDLSLTFNNSAIVLPTLTLSGTLSATTGATGSSITQSGPLTITGNATFAAGSANDITLSNASNNFSTVAITSGNNVTLRDVNALNLAGSTVTGDLTVITGGALSDSGNLVVTGTNGVTATAVGGVTLNSANNQIAKLNVTNSGSGAISVVSINSLSITGFSQNGGGAVSFTDTGTLTVSDSITINTNNAALAITATDIDLSTTGSLNSGTAGTTITQNTVGGSMGLGNAVGNMNLSNAELERITAATLSLIAPNNGQLLIDGVTALATSHIAGTTTLTATAGTLGSITFQGSSSQFTHALNISTDNTVTVNDGVTVTTNNSALSLTAFNLNLNTTGALNSGTADMTIAANNGNMGLGNTVGANMIISNSALQRLTANNLTLTNSATANNQIIVDGVSTTDFTNIAGTVTLDATSVGTGSILFQNGASSFKTLTANAPNGITINAALTTTVGNLTLNANTAGPAGVLALNANLTAAGSVSLSAPGGAAAGIILGGPVSVSGQGVIFNSPVNGAENLTIDAGATNDITFNAAVGTTTRLNTLTITNTNNLINTSSLFVTNFNQLNGNGTTSFGATGLNALGNTSIIGNGVTGHVTVSNLTLDTATANLSGSVNGLSGQAAINLIVLLNTITADTHFFDGIDMFQTQPIPPLPPTPINPNALPQNIFGAYLSDATLPALTQPVLEQNGGNKSRKILQPTRPGNDCISLRPNITVCAPL